MKPKIIMDTYTSNVLEFTEEQKEARTIMNRIGKALIVLGIIDTGYVFWRFYQGMNYGFSLNIFPFIGGIYLLKGSSKAARIIALFANFILFGFMFAVIIVIALMPKDLIFTYLKIRFLNTLVIILVYGVIFAITYWASIRLSRPPVTTAIEQAGLHSKWLSPAVGRYAGIALTIIVIILFQTSRNSSGAKLSIKKVEQEYGAGYKYFVNSVGIDIPNKKTTYGIIVYSNKEIFTKKVPWTKK